MCLKELAKKFHSFLFVRCRKNYVLINYLCNYWMRQKTRGKGRNFGSLGIAPTQDPHLLS